MESHLDQHVLLNMAPMGPDSGCYSTGKGQDYTVGTKTYDVV